MASRGHERTSIPSTTSALALGSAGLESAAIDAAYGLEPVFDPSVSSRDSALSESAAILCPYCGEPIDVTLDLTAGARSYVEDCAVCCHPIEMSIRMTRSGRFAGLSSTRIDG